MTKYKTFDEDVFGAAHHFCTTRPKIIIFVNFQSFYFQSKAIKLYIIRKLKTKLVVLSIQTKHIVHFSWIFLALKLSKKGSRCAAPRIMWPSLLYERHVTCLTTRPYVDVREQCFWRHWRYDNTLYWSNSALYWPALLEYIRNIEPAIRYYIAVSYLV